MGRQEEAMTPVALIYDPPMPGFARTQRSPTSKTRNGCCGG